MNHTHTKIITAEELLAKIRMGVKEIHEIKMREFTLPVRILSISEVNEIRRDARKSAITINGDETDMNILIQRATLKMASTIHGDPILSDKVMEMLTLDEMNFLFNEYIRISESVNPSMENISAEQFRSLVDALKKNNITAKDCSLRQLQEICTAFVDMIQNQESRA